MINLANIYLYSDYGYPTQNMLPSSSISVSEQGRSWRSLNMTNWAGYNGWRFSDAFGYTDSSYNFNGLVGFYNNQATDEKRITKINNLYYPQNTRKLVLNVSGGTDFTYSSDIYALNLTNTNTTYLTTADYKLSDLSGGFTIHLKLSLDADASSNSTIFAFAPSTTFVNPLLNGSFETPVITTDSYRLAPTGVSGWTFAGNSYLLNNSTGWGFPIPYPLGNQCAVLENSTGSISQTVVCLAGTYSLSFYLCAKVVGTANDVNILLNGTVIYTVANATIPATWTKYTLQITVPTSGNNTFVFAGARLDGDPATAIDFIVLAPANSFSIYKDDGINSVKTRYVSNTVERVNSKLFDYSANQIYNLFVSTANSGNTTSYSVCL